jgi:hypothetical protein
MEGVLWKRWFEGDSGSSSRATLCVEAGQSGEIRRALPGHEARRAHERSGDVDKMLNKSENMASWSARCSASSTVTGRVLRDVRDPLLPKQAMGMLESGGA